MNKEQLAASILSSMTNDDWALLEGKADGIPVSEHNRNILLKLRDTDVEFEGDVDDTLVADARARLKDFLEQTWADQPAAHKYVIEASIAQAFLFEMPMHPWKSTRYITRAEGGKIHYYCAAKEKDSVCDFCPAESFDNLNPILEEKRRQVTEKYGERSAFVQKCIFEAGFSDAGVVPTENLVFHKEVREICETNTCRNYGRTWACPPAIGTLEECREKTLGYKYLQVFSKVYKLTDSLDYDEINETLINFKVVVDDLNRILEPYRSEMFLLTNETCDRCEKCTYPDEPCRFPEILYPSIEGFGFNFSELTSLAGINYINGESTVTFFGGVLY